MRAPRIFIACLVIIFSGFGIIAQAQYAYDVTYDDNGIPHITAATNINAVYGQGFEMAKAQGPLLYCIYAKAIGKWVKYYGGPHDLDDPKVQNDYRLALWKIPTMAENTYQKMEREEQLLLRAFADGINDAMASPYVPQSWRDEYPGDREDFLNGIEPWHVVAAYMRYSFKPIVDRYVHLDPLENPSDVREFPTGYSNAWTLLDQNGAAWIQIDPHSHLGNDEYLMTFGCSMDTQESYHWCGFNALGLPLMGVGVKRANPAVPGSQAIAWTITMAPPDMADVYEVPWKKTMQRYKLDGRWRLARNQRITIEYPDPNDDWIFNVPRSPDHGPMVAEDAEQKLIYFGRPVWVVQPSCKNFMAQWNGMLKANNLAEFKQALSSMAFHGGNLLIATNSPNPDERINYMLFCPVPYRGDVPGWENIDWTQPVDGSMSANIWYRAHQFEYLPSADGGQQDHFINCNSSIDITYPGFDENPPLFPHYMTGDLGVYTYRQERAEQLLSELVTVDENQMVEWITDKSHGHARHCVPDLQSANDHWGNDPGIIDPIKLAAAVQMLGGWNQMAEKSSDEMLLFKLWTAKFLERGNYTVYFTFPSERPHFNLSDGILCRDALNALVEAYDLWQSKQLMGKGSWGKNNLYTRYIESGMLQFEMPGDYCCLRALHGPWQGEFSHIVITGGQIVPMIVKLDPAGQPLMKYMKAVDNCTLSDSYMWNNNCPSTTRWASEDFMDF